jgi:hypothetical protein
MEQPGRMAFCTFAGFHEYTAACAASPHGRIVIRSSPLSGYDVVMFQKLRSLWPLTAVALIGCDKLSPPSDIGKTAETVKESANRGAQFAEHAAETAADPDKRGWGEFQHSRHGTV